MVSFVAGVDPPEPLKANPKKNMKATGMRRIQKIVLLSFQVSLKSHAAILEISQREPPRTLT
jgi:hypothetical protein